jgi:hypothetical protein
MRNTFKFLGFIALITVIGFSMAACAVLADIMTERPIVSSDADVRAGDNGIEKTINITCREETYNSGSIAQVTIFRDSVETGAAVARSKKVTFSGNSVSLPLYEASGDGDNGKRWTGTGNYFVYLVINYPALGERAEHKRWYRSSPAKGKERYTFNAAIASFESQFQIPPLEAYLESK